MHSIIELMRFSCSQTWKYLIEIIWMSRIRSTIYEKFKINAAWIETMITLWTSLSGFRTKSEFGYGLIIQKQN